MTKIVASANTLLVTGHTDYAEKGKDILCAAISALVTGSAEIWKNNKEIKVIIDEDSYYFEFNNINEVIKKELGFLIEHLKIIAKNYSKYIKIELKDFAYYREE